MNMVSKYGIFAIVVVIILLAIIIVKNKKMDSTTKFVINGGTFPMDAYVIITNNTVEAQEYAEAILDRKFKPDDFVADGLTLSDDLGSTFVLWFPKETVKDTSIVHHELFHLTYNILDGCGVKLSDETDEVYAYEIESLSKQFYKQLNQ